MERVAALVRRRGQADERADLAAVGKASPAELSAVGLGANLCDAAQRHQAAGNLCGMVRALPDPLIALRLQIQQLAMNEAVAGKLRLQAASQAGGQERTVPDPDRV